MTYPTIRRINNPEQLAEFADEFGLWLADIQKMVEFDAWFDSLPR